MWSLGCVLAEQFTGNVLFANDSVQTILARMQSVLGPFPRHMLDEGADVDKYFTPDRRAVYEETQAESGAAEVCVPLRGRRGRAAFRAQLSLTHSPSPPPTLYNLQFFPPRLL